MAALSANAFKEKLFAVFMLVVSAAMTGQAFSYADDSSQFPRFLALCLLAFCVLYTVQLLRALGMRRKAEAAADPALAKGSLSRIPLAGHMSWAWLSSFSWRTSMPVKVIVLIGVYALGISFIGYYVASFVFLPCSMIVFGRGEATGTPRETGAAGKQAHNKDAGRRRLVGIAMVTLVFLGVTWALFSRFLGTRMPEGLLF